MSETIHNEIIGRKTQVVPLLEFGFSIPSINNGPDWGIIFIDGRIAAGEIDTGKKLPYRLGYESKEDKFKQVNAWAETKLDLRYTTAPPGTKASVEVLTVNEWKTTQIPTEKVVDGIKKMVYEDKPVSTPTKYIVYIIKDIIFS